MSIYSARKKAGKTQKQIADHLGISDSAVNQWEAGKTMPKTEHLVKTASFLGCTVDELLKED